MLGLEGRCYSPVSTFFNGEQDAWVLKGGVLHEWGPCCLPPTPVLDLDLGRKHIYTVAKVSTDWLL